MEFWLSGKLRNETEENKRTHIQTENPTILRAIRGDFGC